MMKPKKQLGFTLKHTIGIGDAVQFTSLPYNYFRTFGEKLIDVNKHWVFDFNPYVDRSGTEPKAVTELWNCWNNKKPPRTTDVYLSLAERHALIFDAKVYSKHPQLYRFDDFPMHKRETVLIHTQGISHSKMPDKVIEHILKKYQGMYLFHVGLPDDPDIGIPKIETPTFWDLAKVCSEARVFIGIDSGPAWIACCYPDVVVKKVRTKPTPEHFENWVPMQVGNIHSHWDDRSFQIYNPTEDDIGMTSSYRRI